VEASEGKSQTITAKFVAGQTITGDKTRKIAIIYEKECEVPDQFKQEGRGQCARGEGSKGSVQVLPWGHNHAHEFRSTARKKRERRETGKKKSKKRGEQVKDTANAR